MFTPTTPVTDAEKTIWDTLLAFIGNAYGAAGLMSNLYASAFSSLFGCPPVTSFSQNVGLVAMTKVVNRFAIMTGAVAIILAGLVPLVGI